MPRTPHGGSENLTATPVITDTVVFQRASDGLDRKVSLQNLSKALGGAISPAVAVTTAAAAGAANVCEVTFTVKDASGTTIAAVHQLDIYLSDAATGAGHTATSASGTVTNKTASGLVVDTQVSKKALTVQTLATGIFILEITDTAKTAFYPVAVLSALGGRASVGTQLITANYG